jgi:hypothetical protein
MHGMMHEMHACMQLLGIFGCTCRNANDFYFVSTEGLLGNIIIKGLMEDSEYRHQRVDGI